MLNSSKIINDYDLNLPVGKSGKKKKPTKYTKFTKKEMD
jgi:hypothetical protein